MLRIQRSPRVLKDASSFVAFDRAEGGGGGGGGWRPEISSPILSHFKQFQQNFHADLTSLNFSFIDMIRVGGWVGGGGGGGRGHN